MALGPRWKARIRSSKAREVEDRMWSAAEAEVPEVVADPEAVADHS